MLLQLPVVVSPAISLLVFSCLKAIAGVWLNFAMTESALIAFVRFSFISMIGDACELVVTFSG